MKVRVFWVPDCDTRNKFGFCKLLPEILEQNLSFGYFGFGYSGFGLRVFCPALALSSLFANLTKIINEKYEIVECQEELLVKENKKIVKLNTCYDSISCLKGSS
jgi:hypothetical protein